MAWGSFSPTAPARGATTDPRATLRGGLARAATFLVLSVAAWLGFQGDVLADWNIEARPSVTALLAGHVGTFLHRAPVYGGSLLLRAPFMVLIHLIGGGGVDVYRAGALPCLAAAAALGIALSEQLARRGCGLLARGLTIVLCTASPLATMAIQQGHPEDLLGAVLCVAAVLCAQRDRAILSGVLVGLACANKAWGILAAGPVLIALPGHRARSITAMLVTTVAVLAPFVLGSSGGFISQSRGVALQSSNIFGPCQLWWFLGSAAPNGARLGPAWLAGVGHTLPIALMAPVCLAYVASTHRTRGGHRNDPMLLLALLLTLRCVLDPWDTEYYFLPSLTALLAWETNTYDRPPLFALGGTGLVWLAFQGVELVPGTTPDATAAAFAAIALPVLAGIGWRLTHGPGGRHAHPADQTAETSCSSATRNEEPQPQAATTLGLSTWNPAPWRPSTKSMVEPST